MNYLKRLPAFCTKVLLIATMVAGLIGVSGCEFVRKVTSGSDESNFEFKQDSQGRLIRLNKVTGEVAIVDGARLIPVKPVANGPAQVPAGSRQPTASGPRLEPTTVSAAGVPGRATTDRTESSTRGAPTASVGQTITSTAAAPVFITPTANQTPLRIANEGSVFKVLGIEGDWYQVEFDDPRWGRRVGFIARRNVNLPSESPDRRAVDLSIPELKFKPQQPVDLSIRRNQEPVDLSIIDKK